MAAANTSSDRKARFGIIFLTIFIDMVGFGIVIPILPLYGEHYGASALQNGLLVASFSFVQFFAAPIWGTISDRVGRKPVLFISILGTAAGFFLMGLANALWILFAARILSGFAGGNIGTAQAYMADITSREERAKAMGLIGAAFGLGFVVGPALGGLMSANFGYQSPMFLAGALAVVNAFLVLAILPESLTPDRRGKVRRESIFAVFQHSDRRVYAVATGTYFCLITGFSMMTFVFALFLWHKFGLDEMATGGILAMVGLIGVVVQGGLIGRLVKSFGEANLATAGAAILGLSLFLLPVVTTVPLLLLASAGLALGNSLLVPSLTGLASRSVDPDWQGRALGLLQSAGSAARWVGPAIAGWLLTLDVDREKSFYAQTPLWAGALVVGIGMLLTFSLPRKALGTKGAESLVAEG